MQYYARIIMYGILEAAWTAVSRHGACVLLAFIQRPCKVCGLFLFKEGLIKPAELDPIANSRPHVNPCGVQDYCVTLHVASPGLVPTCTMQRTLLEHIRGRPLDREAIYRYMFFFIYDVASVEVT